MSTLTIIGIGLIGGSLATDIKRQGKETIIYGVDTCEEHLDMAYKNGWIDHKSLVLDEESANADIVVIATPVITMSSIMQELNKLIRKDSKTVITDVGSTKQYVCEAFRTHMKEHYARCVAAHPIAGSDKSGALAAKLGLFDNKKLVICKHRGQNPDSLEAVKRLWESVGSDVVSMTAKEHDRVFAAVSHLPHLLSFAFMKQIIQDKDQAQLLGFAATGFRDFTRLSGSDPYVWNEITMSNKDEILSRLEEFEKVIQNLKQSVQDGKLLSDWSEIQKKQKEWQAQNKTKQSKIVSSSSSVKKKECSNLQQRSHTQRNHNNRNQKNENKKTSCSMSC